MLKLTDINGSGLIFVDLLSLHVVVLIAALIVAGVLILILIVKLYLIYLTIYVQHHLVYYRDMLSIVVVQLAVVLTVYFDIVAERWGLMICSSLLIAIDLITLFVLCLFPYKA
jgi:hypothetical protein